METFKDYLDKIKYTKEVNKDVKAFIQQYYSKINDNDPEEQIKAQIRDMIKVFPEYETRLNEKGIDLVVKHDKKVVSIFECKSVRRKNEMIEKDNINKKALWELIVNFALLYSENSFPEYMVATNGKKWFIFNSRPFKRLIEDESARTRLGLGKDMRQEENKRDIYNHIKKYFINNSDVLKDFQNNCYYFPKDDSEDIVEDICKFLSPDIMLGKYNPNVGNVLNKDFYDELLYIFGLKEAESNGKKTIVPNGIPNTFYSQINSKLNNYDKSIELIIIWLNRILFLKLFEARLISFKNNYSFSFLNKDKILDTSTLETLFFDVLAVSEQNREQSVESFHYIPYLNSSLFEEKEIEKDFPISKIRGNASVKYFDKTILKDKESKKRKTGEVPLLDYLFEFLNAYNFGEEGNPSSLISPAVLGLVFEKINGYKDGSYYTPTEITDYMAKTAIEKAILSKVKEQLGLDFSDFGEFKKAFFTFSEEARKRIREIIRNLTVLDPAVGSGHFLVSSLNVLLEIWYELGMIDIPKKYEVKFENGDIKLYKYGKPFVYRRNSDEDDAKFQQEVFRAKKEIIENNLFGVDINPKAVEIARLRLWIELLKNTYYKPDETMETLPNIDINIKVGDSLRAPIVDISTTLFNKRIPRLKELFTEYQNTSNKVERKEIVEEFGNIRKEIITGIETAYNDLIWTLDFPHTIDENGQFKGFDVVIGNPPYIDSESMSKTQPEVREYLSREYDMAKGNWDIFVVFIEKGISLLKDNGMLSYIVPNKLISAPYSETLRKYLLTKKVIEIRDLSNINVFEEADVYPIVIIIQNSSIRNDVLVTTMQSTTKIKEQNIIAAEVFYQDIYWDKYFINSVQLALLIKISKFPSLETYAFNISNAATVNEAYKIKEYLQEEGNLTGVQFSKFINTGTISRYVSLWGIKPTTYIKSTYTKPVISYKDLQNISQRRYNQAISPKIIIAGMAKELECLYDDGEYLAGKSTIIITSNNNGSNKSPFQLSFKYLTAILNSKLISFWYRNNFRFSSLAGGYLTISKDRVERIPIPPITDQNQPLVSKIESLVDQILAITKQKNYDPDSSAEETQKVKKLESQIDELVYQLYGLKPDEIAIIESEIKSNNSNNQSNNKKKRNKKGEQEDYEA